MPPKPKKSPTTGVKKKSRVSKRPSKTNLASVEEGPPRGRRNNERSVMQTLEQEETTSVDQANKRSTAQPAQVSQANGQPPKPKDMGTRTVMLPPPPPPQAMIAPQAPQPIQGSQMPPMGSSNGAVGAPPPPPPPPVPRPPQPPIQGSQMPQMNQVQQPLPPPPRPPPGVGQSQVSPSPNVPQAIAPKAAMMPAPAVAIQQSSPAPPVDIAIRKPSREKDDATVDVETSDKKKRNEIITSWIRLVLANGVEGLKKEYKDSFNEAPMEKATVFADNPTRNRYSNIPCCDMTRVKVADDPYFYIHANFVSSGPDPRRFICTQAPLNGTIEDFWKMVIVSGSEYIVMLCELVEKGKPKSAEYFPVKLGDTMKVGKLCTITKESTEDIDKTLAISTMRITKPGDNSVAKIVKHIHWRNWPDHGVPDNFLSPFRLFPKFKNSPKPVVVHCSAGVGRTGTLVLIFIILESIGLPDFLGVPRLLTKLRDERFKSVQTEMQYLYVHRCVLEYLLLKKYPHSREDYTKFAKEYEQVLATCAAVEK